MKRYRVRKYLLFSALAFAFLFASVLSVNGTDPRVAIPQTAIPSQSMKSPHTLDWVAEQPSLVSLTCGTVMNTPVAVNSWQASWRYEVTRARVYWKHCWSSTGAKYINPIAVRGGYEVTDGACGANYNLEGYRFNFGTIGGYNVPAFFVDHQADCGNHRTINIEDESLMIPAYTLGACWGAHITQVWGWPTLDPDKDVSECINY